MNLVAIIVPLTERPVLTRDEEISLRHVDYFLGKYDKYFIAPKGTSFSREGFDLMTFPKRYFGTMDAHGRLQLSEDLYTRFRGYKYILMHHLDALVLSDRLSEWCEADLDFVGAPWLPCEDSPWVRQARVGNSGFALMKVESCLSVIRSRRPTVDPDDDWRQFCAAHPPHKRWLHFPRKYLRRLRAFNSVKWETWRWTSRDNGMGAGDLFWSDRAVRYWPEFKIASFEQGLSFAFEAAPRLCFELNGRRLPFGCHAWPRDDRAFWEPYLLK